MVVDPRIPARRIVQKSDRRQNGVCSRGLGSWLRCQVADDQRSYLHGHSAHSRASSRHSGGKGGHGRTTLIPDTVLPVYSGDRAIRFSRAVASRRAGPRVPVVGSGGQHPMVTRPRLTGMSRTTPIGLLQRVSGARRLRVTSGLPAPRPLCRSTFRQASVRETPNAEARGCVRRRRTSRVDAPW